MDLPNRAEGCESSREQSVGVVKGLRRELKACEIQQGKFFLC